jgi:hypothetical protein
MFLKIDFLFFFLTIMNGYDFRFDNFSKVVKSFAFKII